MEKQKEKQKPAFDYNTIGPGYYHESMLHGKRGPRFWHKKRFEQLMARFPQGTYSVLDIACGPASLFYVLRKKNKKCSLTGIDIAPEQIAYAKKIVKDATFLVSDIGKLPFPDNSFDYVTSTELIEHLTKKSEKKMLSEVRRVLKPGGRFIITTPNYHSIWPAFEWMWNRISPVSYEDQHINKKNIDSLEATLKKAGFSVTYTSTYFIISQVFAIVSFSLAEWLFNLEKRIFPRLGMTILIEAEK
jgi:ubiquinone/menaquinone biosynthesis C-methylase UbiE